MKTVWSILTAVFLLPVLAIAQVPQVERDALIELYNSTDGDNWGSSTGWKAPPLHTDGFAMPGLECLWYGIACDDEGNSVVEVNLYDNQLSGSIPQEVATLSELRNLNLRQNQLNGGIPPELGGLSALQELSVSNNQISGGIPTELGNLDALVSLGLNGNQLTGMIPPELGTLNSLVGLYLFSNGLSGSIPPEIGNLSSLVYIALGGNNLSGSIPPQLGNLTSLTSLQIQGNQFSGNIPTELGNISGLSSLFLNNNFLTGEIPVELANISSLTRLFLSSNELSGTIPPELGDLSSLRWLGLSSNQLSGGIPEEVGNLQNLELLYLQFNRLIGEIPVQIGNLSSLQDLNLASNRFSGSIPPELVNLTSLSTADISYNALWTDDAILQTFLEIFDPNWSETQTIAPEGMTITAVSDRTVWLEWTPVEWITEHGGYEIFSSEVGGRDRTSAGYTVSKETSTFPVTSLQPGLTYDLSVNTYTRPHLENLNWVSSDETEPIMATTSTVGCDTPTVTVSGSSVPYTLTVTSNHDTFEWVTGEQTESISVYPHWASWYWVKTTGPDGCNEAGMALAPVLFYDGFESGNTDFWDYRTN